MPICLTACAAVQSAGSVPITIKVRKGINDELLTFHSAGRIAQEEGCAGIGLHGRTAAELYSGQADWDAISSLVQALQIPVLGNGDIWEAQDALAMLRETGCQGIIVGRGCLGRPWLFREMAALFEGRMPAPAPAFGEVMDTMVDHAQRLIDFFGPEQGMRQMRKWCTWYTIGFPGSARARAELVRVSSMEEMLRVLERCPRETPFPVNALRAKRGKAGRRQMVSLPEGYLDDLDDDAPPRSPRSPEEIAAWERALQGG